MTLEQEKKTAKFLDSRLDDKTAAEVEKWNLALLGLTLAHDADHIMQARRWHYHIPLQLWVINLAVYVLPTVTEFLVRNKRASSFSAAAIGSLLTTVAFNKVHSRASGTRASSSRASSGMTGRCCWIWSCCASR